MEQIRGDGRMTERETAEDARKRPEPDSRARTHLANERTFLAWLRTGVGLMVLGVGAAQFLGVDQALVQGIRPISDFAAILIVGGALIVVVGGIRYGRGREQIDRASFQPAGRSVAAATAFVVVVAILSLVLVYLLGRSS